MTSEIYLLLQKFLSEETLIQHLHFACQTSEVEHSSLMVRCIFVDALHLESEDKPSHQFVFGFETLIHTFELSECCKFLDLIFDKQDIRIDLYQHQTHDNIDLESVMIARRGPRTATFILQALKDLSLRTEDQLTACLLLKALLSTTFDLLTNPATTLGRSQTLFEQMRNYIEDNFQQNLSRESVAAHFYISPNYVSHIFQREASMRFQEYLTYIRLEHAKDMLRHYDLKIKDIARRCGFNDSNYFCKLFKDKTARSPTEYRVHYQGQQGL